MIRRLLLTLDILVVLMAANCVMPQPAKPRDLSTVAVSPPKTQTLVPSAMQPTLAVSSTPEATFRPCTQPCWEGLRPGEATQQDLEQYFTLHLSARERESYRQDDHAEGACQRYSWKSDVGGRARTAYLEDGVLKYVEVVADPGLSLGDLVAKYGPPEYVYAVAEKVLGSPGSRPSRSVLFPRQGLAFELYAKDTHELRPEYLVRTIRYFSPGDLLNTVRASIWCQQAAPMYSFIVADEDVYYMQPWHGFGGIQVFYKELNALPIQRRTPAATPIAVEP